MFSVTAVLPYLTSCRNQHHLRPRVSGSHPLQQCATEGDEPAPPCNRSQEPLVKKEPSLV
uniref:Uncharacterized protein n=1 Tax=Arundo donax TaxID=35708 RepID=A0A0A9F9I6_ARUDO